MSHNFKKLHKTDNLDELNNSWPTFRNTCIKQYIKMCNYNELVNKFIAKRYMKNIDYTHPYDNFKSVISYENINNFSNFKYFRSK